MFYYLVTVPLVVLVTVAYSLASIVRLALNPGGRFYYRMFRGWSRSLLWLLRVRVKVHGAERLQPGVTYIYIANHASHLDIIVLVGHVPDDIRFIYKKELVKIPVFGWSLRMSPNIMIDRGDPREAMESLERAAAEIRDGKASVVIFPEGTRSPDGGLQEFKRGGFLVATRTGVPIVPVAVTGTAALLPKDSLRVRPGHVEVFIGTPIPVARGIGRQEERQILAETRRQLEEMMGGVESRESGVESPESRNATR